MLTRRDTFEICLRHRSDLVIDVKTTEKRREKRVSFQPKFKFIRSQKKWMQKKKNPSFIFWFWKNRIFCWVDWSGMESSDALYPVGFIVFCFGWYGMSCVVPIFGRRERFRSFEIDFCLCCALDDGKWSPIHLNCYRILSRSFFVCESIHCGDLSIAANDCIFFVCKWFVYFYVNRVEFEIIFRCIQCAFSGFNRKIMWNWILSNSKSRDFSHFNDPLPLSVEWMLVGARWTNYLSFFIIYFFTFGIWIRIERNGRNHLGSEYAQLMPEYQQAHSVYRHRHIVLPISQR